MDMQAALRSRLIGATDAGSHVTWVARPQGAALPAITLQTISGDRPRTYNGMQALRESRVQLDTWAGSYAAARTIAEQAVTALVDRATVNGIYFDQVDFEGEADLSENLETQLIYRTRLDLLVWHSPA